MESKEHWPRAIRSMGSGFELRESMWFESALLVKEKERERMATEGERKRKTNAWHVVDGSQTNVYCEMRTMAALASRLPHALTAHLHVLGNKKKLFVQIRNWVFVCFLDWHHSQWRSEKTVYLNASSQNVLERAGAFPWINFVYGRNACCAILLLSGVICWMNGF